VRQIVASSLDDAEPRPLVRMTSRTAAGRMADLAMNLSADAPVHGSVNFNDRRAGTGAAIGNSSRLADGAGADRRALFATLRLPCGVSGLRSGDARS
jgi:hypothetical protein